MENRLDELPEDKLKKINITLNAFIEKNKKKYINKISTKEWTVYEYEEEYIWYISDTKINFKETFNFLFKKREIQAIYIDNYKRISKDFENIEEDLINAEKIKIIISAKEKPLS